MVYGKNVLIVSYHFPPMNIMGAKRYGQMCQYMEDWGYTPRVLTTYSRGGGFEGAKLDLPVPIAREQIIRIGLMGIVYPVQDPLKSAAIEIFDQRRWMSRIVTQGSFGWYEKVKRSLDFNKLKNIDIVLGTFPPIDNILAGKYIAQKLGVPFIAEIRDLISDYEEHPSGWQRMKMLDRGLERILLRDVDGIVTVTEGFQRILRDRYPKQAFATVYNGWDGNNSPECQSGPSLKKYLYYAGMMYEHRLESFRLLFQVISRHCPDLEVKIRSLGPAYLNKELKCLIERYNLNNRVKVLPPEVECVVSRERAGAYINLLPSSPHEGDKALLATLPGKLFELLQYAPPILALAPEQSEIGNVLALTEKGIASVDEEVICAYLMGTNTHYEGNELVNDFSRKNQTRVLCAFMDNIIKKQRG